jgi:hypothetical protein
MSEMSDERVTTDRLSTEQLADMRPDEPAQRMGDTDSSGTAGAGLGAAEAGDDSRAELLEPGDREAMTSKWHDIQADFVDHPRQAMKDADTLVAGLMQQLAQTFARERSQLEAQWSRGDEVSTEDLRVSLQRYRAFFERLLSA